MRIDFVEIRNFRRLVATRIDFSEKTTLLVGANNSGKTSAITALRYFLLRQNSFTACDIPLSWWTAVDTIGIEYEKEECVLSQSDWWNVLPSLDVWLVVSPEEVHHIQHLIPTLDWKSDEGIGVRLQLEPKDLPLLRETYLKAKTAASEALNSRRTNAESEVGNQNGAASNGRKFALWPESLMDFLKKRMPAVLDVHAYLLDPSKKKQPKDGVAQPQMLPVDAAPLDGDPLKGLLKIAVVPAHRGFSDSSAVRIDSEDSDQNDRDRKQRLTAQLRAYFGKHLDPLKSPGPSDVRALEAIHEAQVAFDARLTGCFAAPLQELEQLGYPGVANPRLVISTSIKPVEGLKHDSAVQYDIAPVGCKGTETQYRLPEQCNGLGYQNLISMVFQLISFRDDWMKVGKAALEEKEEHAIGATQPPLHLVMVEEPEAHLHVQAQQVFIRKAYDVLRNHPDLLGKDTLTTQLLVSTHSSHIAHEVDFAQMRYFRRHPARRLGETPTSTIINLSEIFGAPDETARFVSRYLRATHADLFFADGAILVEGAAERILVPHFIHKHFQRLFSCYVTVLEVGGSHAHRLRPLLEHLGLNTLIITDVDAVDVKTGVSVAPLENGDQTANEVLKTWHPQKTTIADLMKLSSNDKERSYSELFSVRIAYQTQVEVELTDQCKGPLLPRTFEDALVLENLHYFQGTELPGFFKKCKTAINSSTTLSELSKSLHDAVRSATKAGVALEILYSDPAAVNVPSYISDGLNWLQDKLLKRQHEILISDSQKQVNSEEAAK